jgi:hypothetical protein
MKIKRSESFGEDDRVTFVGCINSKIRQINELYASLPLEARYQRPNLAGISGVVKKIYSIHQAGI